MRRYRDRSGFSLIEVILATAILMGSLTVLAQLARLGYRNARSARLEMTAQLLCEAKLAEIVCGIAPAEEATETPFEEQPKWLYSVLVTPVEEPAGLVSVQVTVREDVPEERHSTEVKLTRWTFQPAAATSAAGDSATPAGSGAPASSSDTLPGWE